MRRDRSIGVWSGPRLVRFDAVAEESNSTASVFIGGLPRSGTTLLAAEIARSPGVANLEGIGPVADEGQYGAGRLRHPAAVRRYRPLRLRSRDAPHRGVPLAIDSSRSALWEAWAPYWDTTAPVLVEKTPSNLLKMRFLQAVFRVRPSSWWSATPWRRPWPSGARMVPSDGGPTCRPLGARP